MQDKNTLTISGMVNVIEKSHEFHGEQFFRIMLDVIRLSENVDTVPIIVSEKLLFNNEVSPGMFITVAGQIRTKNHKEGNARSKLLVFGYASDVNQITEQEMLASEIKNYVEMEGYICKVPTHRPTNAGRVITDLLIACNRQYSKSDYVPCITWGSTAKMASKLRVGDKVKFIGRFQSREYRKKTDEVGVVNTAYEISIKQIELIPETTDAVVENIDLREAVLKTKFKPRIEVTVEKQNPCSVLARNMHKNRGIVYKQVV